jgi:ABC-type multidrug transport system ATPase subunit
MDALCEVRHLTKSFGSVRALDDVTLGIPRGSVVGLVGKNGSGKTTLLRHLVGFYLPSAGDAVTLGRPSAELGAGELARIGFAQQEPRFIDWMSVGHHVRYVASFYPRWDRDLEARLMAELELDPRARVGTLSPGNAQKLGLLLAVAHHPELLLLDEPVNALDPIARERFLAFLLAEVREEGTTAVISSHVLRDVEAVVDWLICLDGGRLAVSASFDELRERYEEWVVTSREPLPERFDEPFVLRQEVNCNVARLLVVGGGEALAGFQARYGVQVVVRPLNL